MDTTREQFRFAETNRVLTEQAKALVGRLLEVGSGEGHQSEWLSRVTDRLTGIDVSPTAIKRARTRVPTGHFVAGDLYTQPWAHERGHFDVVTACEVIYYMSDMPRFLRTMDRLGHACLVTYFAPAARKVAVHVDAMPGVERSSFHYGDVEWIAAWWPGAAARGPLPLVLGREPLAHARKISATAYTSAT